MADLADTVGGTSDNYGIYRSNGGTPTKIIRKGQAAPDGNGVFSTFDDLVMNNSGQVVMSSQLTGTQGGFGDSYGVFTSDGIDLIQNGSLIVAANGNTVGRVVMFGAFTGSGGFTGGGDVFALGDLRPGNSPASVLYDGNLFLGLATNTFIELGGDGPGLFDQMLVTGDLNLAGNLFVSLINGHSLGFNQSYLIGDIGGNLFGQFNGLAEGDLVGNFGGMDLFISYTAGSGNGVSLFTAVPEPNSGILVTTVFWELLRSRRPRKTIGQI